MMKKLFICVLSITILLSSISFVSAEDINGTIVEDTNQELISTGSVQLEQSSNTNTSQSAFLFIDDDADKENIHIGEYVTFNVFVENLGPDKAQNVKVYDKLPEGLKYCYHTLTKGIFNPATGIWDIGDLDVSEDGVELFITCVALTAGEKINKVWITSDTVNLNPKTYEQEEIDVLEDDINHIVNAKKAIVDSNATGNPIFLVLIALFVFAVPPFILKK